MTIKNRNVKVTEVIEEPPTLRQTPRHRTSTMSLVADVLKRNLNEWVRVLEQPHKPGRSQQPDRQYFDGLGYELECSPFYDWDNKVTLVYMKLSQTLVKQGNPEGEQSL
jgi:hypothetical protein